MNMRNKKGQTGWIATGIIALLVLILVLSSFYTIDSGQEGVLLTWGQAAATPVGPGIHAKMPIAQGVVKFDMRTQNFGIDGSKTSLETASSADLQIVKIQVALNYRLAAGTSAKVFSEIGADYEDVVIQPVVHDTVKAVTAQYTAEELIKKREEVRAKIAQQLTEKLRPRNIIVEEVSIVNFDFSEQFNIAIEQKVTQEQNALAAQNKLAQIRFEADQVRAKAEGERDAAIAQATGEAEKVKLIQQQLSQSPQYIEYIRAQRWDGKYPVYYMALAGNGVTPLLNVPSPTGAMSNSNSSN